MITLASPHIHQQLIKHSRFIAKAAPISNSEEAPRFLAQVREEEATHNCWAFKAGQRYRFSDDGEPGGTAGQPILRAIEGQGLDGVMVVVVRYYGGVNLGAGGLVRAYGGTAAACLRLAPKREVVQMVRVRLEAPFDQCGTIYTLLEKLGLERLNEGYSETGICLEVEVQASETETFHTFMRDATRGKARLQFFP
jgi:uncharacterized YigZ family protein